MPTPPRRRPPRCRLLSASTHAESKAFSFPATYEFTPKTTAKQLVEDQIAHFNDNWAKVDQRFAKTKQLTPYDVLIIASMVEKETIAPGERPNSWRP